MRRTCRHAATSLDRGGRSARGGILVVVLAVAISLAACGQPSVDVEPSALPELGAAVYAAECVACHGGRDGQGARAGAPPHGPSGHTWHHPDAQLRERILMGGPFEMPGFRDRLSDPKVEAVLAYIKTWWTDEQRADQSDISARYAQAAAPEANTDR